jgi:microcystin-dependent protein
MADEPRGYNPGWTDPREPGTDPIATGPQEPTPTTGVPPDSLPPPIKGDDAIKVDYDGSAYVIRLDVGEALVVEPNTPGLWAPVWNAADGRTYRVDFSSLHARIRDLDIEFSDAISLGLAQIQANVAASQTAFTNTVEIRLNTYEASLTARLDQYELLLTNRQDAFEADELQARQSFETTLVNRIDTFEDQQTDRQDAFEAFMAGSFDTFRTDELASNTAFQNMVQADIAAFQASESTLRLDWMNTLEARQDTFEGSELANRAAFEQGVNTTLATQDQRILTVETAWTSYQGTVNARLDTFEADVTADIAALDQRVAAAEATANQAAADVAAGAIPDRAVDFIKLSEAVEAMLRDKSWASITDKPDTATRWATWNEVTDKPAVFAPAAHTHPTSEVTGLDTALASKGNLTGGNVWSGTQTFRSTSGALQNYVERPAGQTAYWTFRTGTSNRWQFGVNSTSESGGNAGTKFLLKRFSDAGAEIDTPMEFDRATGAMKLTVRPSWNGYTPWDSNNFDPNTTIMDRFIGMGFPFAGQDAQLDPGFLIADGRNVSRTTYAKLFAKIGTTHGAGDGSTTFTLPDWRGRSLFGKDRATGRVTAYLGDAFGAVGGSQYLQSHSHRVVGNSGYISHDHGHAGYTSTDGNHNHGMTYAPTGLTTGGAAMRVGGARSSHDTTTLDAGSHSHTIQTYGVQTNHYHGIDITSYDASVTVGSSGNIPPAAVVTWAIYAGA